jgi:hypothetical protein
MKEYPPPTHPKIHNMNQMDAEPEEDLKTDGMNMLSWNTLDCLCQKVEEEQDVGER